MSLSTLFLAPQSRSPRRRAWHRPRPGIARSAARQSLGRDRRATASAPACVRVHAHPRPAGGTWTRQSVKHSGTTSWPAARPCCGRRTCSPGHRADAEDLLQTALAKTYLAWGRIREREALDGYVRRVMVNTRTSWWRRHKVDESPTADLPERAGPRRTRRPRPARRAVDRAGRLPKRQRAAVVLRYYEDLTEAQTAEVLGVSVGTVKSTTSKALARLRQTPPATTSTSPDPAEGALR